MTDAVPAFVLAPQTAAKGFVGIFSHTGNSLAVGDAPIRWLPGSQAHRVVVFLPGNPGILAFYEEFLLLLHEQLKGEVSIFGHPYLGHTPGFTCTSNTSLNAQIDAFVNVVDVLATNGCSDITLIGHSVGTWVSVQVLKRRPDLVNKVIMVTPTISELRQTPNGRRVGWLLNPPLPRAISIASRLLHWLPEAALAALYSDWPRSQVQVLQGLLRSPSSIFNALSMAHDEMNQIKVIEAEFLTKHGEKVWAVFAENDQWVGEQEGVVVNVLGASERLSVLKVPHAFSINHSQLVAARLSDVI